MREKFAALAAEIGDGRTPEAVAEGFVTIAVENMANAIKKISVQRGYDVTDYLLNCFGGAGGQHACLVADALGMEAVLIHPFSGLLSAYGIGLSGVFASRQQALLQPLAEESAAGDRRADRRRCATPCSRNSPRRASPQDDVSLAAGAAHPLRRHRHRAAGRTSARGSIGDARASLRGRAQGAVRLRLRRQADGRRGRRRRGQRRRASAAATKPNRRCEEIDATPSETREIFVDGAWRDAGVFRREALQPGHRIAGPALIIESHQTIVVEPGWQAEITAKNHVLLRRIEKKRRQAALGTEADPVMLEVFNNLFMSIAEQMGVTLQNTAYSVNIKERLDFSCAVFDRTGALVANAPHMPVHLGSMDRSVETIIRLNEGDIHPGDVFALNAPYNGGTHLPDITVVTPVFDDAGKEILFYVASRGHHADVGGTAPGSMTPLATTVDEEGVLIDNFRIVERGRFREKELHALLTDHPYPARNLAPEHRRPQGADRRQREGRGRAAQDGRAFRARRGRGLYGPRPGQRRRERAPRAGAPARHSPHYEYPTDTGQVIKVKITVDREKREATVDFTGTSPVHEEQLQRAGAGGARGRALRLPRHGRGHDPDECRLPAADQHRHPRRLHAEARLSGRGRRRQCRDLAARHQRAVRRDGRARQRARHDEQPHLRQRARTSITRRSARARRPAA